MNKSFRVLETTREIYMDDITLNSMKNSLYFDTQYGRP